jgi:hypothetical protein
VELALRREQQKIRYVLVYCETYAAVQFRIANGERSDQYVSHLDSKGPDTTNPREI